MEAEKCSKLCGVIIVVFNKSHISTLVESIITNNVINQNKHVHIYEYDKHLSYITGTNAQTLLITYI